MAEESLPRGFASVAPNVNSDAYQYTIWKKSGAAIEVTASAPSVKEFFRRLFPAPDAKDGFERTEDGQHVFFPEAVVRIFDNSESLVDAVVSGWIDMGDEDGEDEDEDDPEPEEKPELARRKPKWAKSGRG